MADLTWEEPPKTRRHKGERIVHQLKQNMGKWAKVDLTGSAAYALRRRHPELEVRQVQGAVYLRAVK